MKTTHLGLIALLSLGCGGEETSAPAPILPGTPSPGNGIQPPGIQPPVAQPPGAPAAASGNAAPVTLTVDAATQAQSTAFAAALAEAPGRRPEGITELATARAVLHLAATSTDEDTLKRAFGTLLSLYTRDDWTAERGTRLLSDADVERVVVGRIDHPVGGVREMVIKATQVLLDEPENSSPDAVAALVRIASSDPNLGARYIALDVLGSSRAAQDNAAHMAPFLAAFTSSEPWLVSQSLKQFESLSRRHPDKAAVRAMVTPLLQHADPGVRGRAVGVLVNTTERGSEAATATLVLPLLDDPYAYVRSEAASGLGRLRHTPAIHALVTHLDDTAENTYDIPFTELDGSTGRVHHDGSAWSRVDDAMLRALHGLTRLVDSDRPDYRPGGDDVPADIEGAKTAYRAWYASHRAEIPS